MKARVECDWQGQRVNIWIWQASVEGGAGYLIRLTEGEGWGYDLEDIAPGVAPPTPTCSLPLEAFEALIAAGVDFAPPSSAQAAHLKDALAIRDRLLTLVENEMDVKR